MCCAVESPKIHAIAKSLRRNAFIESSGAGDGVKGNFKSKVVFSGAFICALECLQKTISESVKDWPIGASNYETIDVRTE